MRRGIGINSSRRWPRRRRGHKPMRHMALIATLLLLGSAATGAAQSGGAGFPADVVNRFVESELVRQRIPGVSIAVLRGDSVVLVRGYGYANLELHVPASDSTIYQ